MKLDIIYRCCNAEVDTRQLRDIRPPWFDKINCLRAFLDSVERHKEYVNRLIFLYDGPKGRLYDNIPLEYETVCIDHQDNEKSLMESFEIADTLKENIYFIEDDYMHLAQSIKTIALGVQNFKLVTGYDHLDRYRRGDDITLGKDYVAFSNKTNCHWRTCESTCCTWATTQNDWKEIMAPMARSYKLNDRELFRNIYVEYSLRLWNPIPAVTTQVDHALAPGIDWKAVNDTWKDK